MAKKKKTQKKIAKKKTAKKKKVAKKKKRKKAKSKTPAPKKPRVQYKGLQAKRFEIMKAVPQMPCSAISKDFQGLQYCHTQATDVYQIYRNEMKDRGLTINMIGCKSESVLVYEESKETPTIINQNIALEKKHIKNYNSRSHCTFRITDTESGQYDDIQSTALGNNDVWSDNSAQTVAMKQALLQYYFTSWPQPLDHVEVVRSSLTELGGDEFKKAVTAMMPLKIMGVKGAVAALESFFKVTCK